MPPCLASCEAERPAAQSPDGSRLLPHRQICQVLMGLGRTGVVRLGWRAEGTGSGKRVNAVTWESDSVSFVVYRGLSRS